MHEKKGVDLLLGAYLQLQRERADLPALVVTGHAGAGGLARLPGDVPILRKPFRQEDLLRALDPLCAATSRAETTAAA